jgi:predicted dehydrogenase
MTTVSPIRVGVVGCGLIAQTMHLRTLADLPQFHVTAVCDADALVAETVGARFGIPTRVSSFEDLAGREDVDAVLVSTPDHYPPALAALSRGKHLLVEKPLCWTPAEGRELVAAADDAGVVAIVGYMRRYDGAYEAALEHVRRLGRIRYGRIHDFACRFDKDRPLYDLAVPASSEGTPRRDFERRRDDLVAALGPEEAERFGSLYFMLLMLGSHDLAMARGIFGDPVEVTSANAFDDVSLLVRLDYEASGPCVLELSVGTRYEWFDEEVALFGEDDALVLRLADPFVQYARSTVTRRTARDEGFEDRVFTSGAADAFRREWMHFARCIHDGEQPRTPLRDGVADLELAVEIVRRIPLTAPAPLGVVVEEGA